MARAKANKLYRSFVKGLITEAGFLTYPENASSDELNTVLSRKGNRSRRPGIDYEPDSVAFGTDYDNTVLTNEFLWKAPDNKADMNFLVVQMGTQVKIFSTEDRPTLSPQLLHIDLNTYKSPSATEPDIRLSPCQFASGKGFLFIVQEYIEPLVVEWDSESNTFSVQKIVIQVRDFDGVNDGLANDQQPVELSKEHEYNLKNQGWVSPGKTSTPPGTPPANPWTGDPNTGYFDPTYGGVIFL